MHQRDSKDLNRTPAWFLHISVSPWSALCGGSVVASIPLLTCDRPEACQRTTGTLLPDVHCSRTVLEHVMWFAVAAIPDLYLGVLPNDARFRAIARDETPWELRSAESMIAHSSCRWNKFTAFLIPLIRIYMGLKFDVSTFGTGSVGPISIGRSNQRSEVRNR